MKKIIAILLTAITLFSLTSCDPKEANRPNQSQNDLDDDLISRNPDKSNTNNVTPAKHNVYFIVNGGDPLASIQTNKIDIAPTTTKPNHLFEGWFLDSTLTVAAIFPLEVTNDTTLYAKWLKIADTQKLADCSIKSWDPYKNRTVYYVTPSGFDLDALETKGYKAISIEISYQVNYTKDYDIPLDVGYMGAPKYSVSLADSDGYGKHEQDLATVKDKITRTISKTVSISDLRNTSIKLEFSTNDVQNIVHFSNMVTTYQCK